jgi:TetR/AcrR family transcriptional repressor of nem operon
MKKGEITRQSIIEKSAPIFNTKGIAATAMSDIMEATKLSKGSLYVHFDNKEDLAAVVVDYILEQLRLKLIASINKHKGAKEQLFAYFDQYIDSMHPPMVGGCPMMNFGTEADDLNQVIRKRVNKSIDGAQTLMEDIIKKGIADGVFKPEWDYKEFAALAFAMIEGGILINRVSGNNSKMKIINRNLKQMVEANLL